RDSSGKSPDRERKSGRGKLSRSFGKLFVMVRLYGLCGAGELQLYDRNDVVDLRKVPGRTLDQQSTLQGPEHRPRNLGRWRLQPELAARSAALEDIGQPGLMGLEEMLDALTDLRRQRQHFARKRGAKADPVGRFSELQVRLNVEIQHCHRRLRRVVGN